MLGSQNHRRMNATLALRLKIDDLHAHLRRSSVMAFLD